MPIQFRCEHCRTEVTAPDGAGGKRGKCPHCGQSNYIPAPVSEEEIIPMAPLDEEEERRRAEQLKALRQREEELLSDNGPEPEAPPLEHREDLKPKELYHFVVNYCLDIANSQLERAEGHVATLRKFGEQGKQAVDDFLTGTAIEPALGAIPPAVLQGFLKELRRQLV